MPNCIICGHISNTTTEHREHLNNCGQTKTPPKPELEGIYSAHKWNEMNSLANIEQQFIREKVIRGKPISKDIILPANDAYTKESVDALFEWYEDRLKEMRK
jgi:hypothetical protein